MKTNKPVTFVYNSRYGQFEPFKGQDLHKMLESKITVPKGAAVSHQTACGVDVNYHFVSDLSFIKPINGVPQYGLRHDASTRGINVPKEFIDYENI